MLGRLCGGEEQFFFLKKLFFFGQNFFFIGETSFGVALLCQSFAWLCKVLAWILFQTAGQTKTQIHTIMLNYTIDILKVIIKLDSFTLLFGNNKTINRCVSPNITSYLAINCNQEYYQYQVM